MPHSASSNPAAVKTLSVSVQRTLLTVARQSLHAAAAGQTYMPGVTNEPELLQHGACFTTLTQHGQLRGCIGSLEAWRPLLLDVAENAKAAAMHDPRFPAVRLLEVDNIHIEISVLTPPQAIAFSSQEDLLQKIQPFVDGLILEEGGRRSTFLPLVWEQLPDPRLFLRQLKLKAGLPQDYWSDTVRVYRYHTQVFEE